RLETPLKEDNEELKILNENFLPNIDNKQKLDDYIYIIVELPAVTDWNFWDDFGKLYPGAYGEDIYTQLHVVLKKLHVFFNGTSADFVDIILVRMNSAICLFMIQCRWDYGSKEMTEKTVDDEDAKN
ncbi:42816_t:CDS:2, partial [Gigaspora margarita]